MRALAVLFLLFLAAPSEAATVRVAKRLSHDIRPDVGDFSRVRIDARPGERNRVTVRVRGRTALVVDRGARLRAGRRCRLVDRHTARCRFDAYLPPYVLAELGDRDDRFRALPGTRVTHRADGGDGDDDLRGSAYRDVLDGEAGDDRIRAGRGNDDLYDGPGRDLVAGGAGDDDFGSTDGDVVDDDRFDGGAGRDLIGFFGRDHRVVARLGGSGGTRGEHDRLRRLEGLEGGNAGDVLYGTPGDDDLRGYTGDDVIHAGRGDDLISPGMGSRNRVFAGPGDDRVTPFGHLGSRADLHCGPGRDVAEGGDGEYDLFLLRPDCEHVQYYDRPLLAQPLRVTERSVRLQVHCGWSDSAREVALTTTAGTIATARRDVRSRDGAICPVTLRLTALGRGLRRPTPVHVEYPDDGLPDVPEWRFVLRPACPECRA